MLIVNVGALLVHPERAIAREGLRPIM
jgi:hypothetical protein